MIAIAGTFAALPFMPAEDRSDLLSGDNAVPPIMLAFGLIAQQGAQLLWPLVVSKWKGFGPVHDWKIKFKPIDIVIGGATGFGLLVVAGILGVVFNALVSDDTLEASENTSFLTDAEGSPFLWVLVFGAVVGAPVVEEVFFRGLTLRAFEKRLGKVWAVVGSTIVFVLPHFTGADLGPTLVLFTTIGVVGAALGVLVVKVGRLAPAILAHMVFNGVGVAAVLISETLDTSAATLFLPF